MIFYSAHWTAGISLALPGLVLALQNGTRADPTATVERAIDNPFKLARVLLRDGD